MKTLKKIIGKPLLNFEKLGDNNRICKYCGVTFADIIEMYQSQRHGYYICQECFKDRQEQRLVI